MQATFAAARSIGHLLILMAPTDFSHVQPRPWSPADIVTLLAKGARIADRIVLQAIDQCSPPLLSASSMIMLRRELTENALRRGRPRAGAPTRQSLVAELAGLERSDIPAVFIDWLVGRLKSGRSATEQTRGDHYHRLSVRHRRDVLIEAVYRRIYAALDGAEVVEVPPFGAIQVSPNIGSKSEQALALTQDLLRNLSPVPPPSRARMLNIISEKSSRKT
jgi:hypothetical protein